VLAHDHANVLSLMNITDTGLMHKSRVAVKKKSDSEIIVHIDCDSKKTNVTITVLIVHLLTDYLYRWYLTTLQLLMCVSI